MLEDPWALVALVSGLVALVVFVAHLAGDKHADRSSRQAREIAERAAYLRGRIATLTALRPVAEALDAGDRTEAARRFVRALTELAQEPPADEPRKDA